MSLQRTPTNLEKIEKKILERDNTTIPYHESLTAYLLAKQYIKVLGPILDFSSINNSESYVKKAFLDQCTALTRQVEFLIQVTSRRPHKLKDEASGMCLKNVINPSSKQYHIQLLNPENLYPHLTMDGVPLTKKIKGIPKKHQSSIGFSQFKNVAIKNLPPQKIVTRRLQRNSYRIYLIQQSKKCLSRLTTKRLFDKRARNRICYCSFPLNWLNFL